MKLIDWTLCLVSDPEVARGREILPLIEESVDAGVTLIQLRGKKLKIRDFLELALETSKVLRAKNIPLIINDRIDIALSCEASGVHLGQEDLPLPFARKILGKNKWIGITVNTVKEALEAEAQGADYLGVGPIFYTPAKKELKPLLGLTGLKAIKEKVKIPILAIGGINAKNARGVIASGADGIAVISAIMAEEDIHRATRDLIREIRSKTKESV